jgi:hypothetical protein
LVFEEKGESYPTAKKLKITWIKRRARRRRTLRP